MKRTVKLLALLCALVLLFSTIAGCKQPDSTTGTETITMQTDSAVVTPEPTNGNFPASIINRPDFSDTGIHSRV